MSFFNINYLIYLPLAKQTQTPEVSSARTYTLNCRGAMGNMVRIRDLDFTAQYGHSIAEVKIYGPGPGKGNKTLYAISRIRTDKVVQVRVQINTLHSVRRYEMVGRRYRYRTLRPFVRHATRS